MGKPSEPELLVSQRYVGKSRKSGTTEEGVSGVNRWCLPWTGQQTWAAIKALPECPVCSRRPSVVLHALTLQRGHRVCSAGCVGVRTGTGKGDAVLGSSGLEPSPFRLLGGSVALDMLHS